jgi:hypothetical protein
MIGTVVITEGPRMMWICQNGRKRELPHYLFFVGEKKAALLILNDLEGALAGVS